MKILKAESVGSRQATRDLNSTSRLVMAAAAMAAMSFGAASGASAQAVPATTATVNASDAGAGAALETVVVTARKVNESLLDVPVAVSAFSAKSLTAVNITSLTDIVAYTPGFTLNNAGSDHVDRAVQNLYLRGMAASVTPSVSVFIDGSPVASGFVAGIDDAARVELLKGPQTAFFGRLTFGGAVNIVSKDPSTTEHLTLDGLYGSDSTYDVRGRAEGPIFGDILTGRITARVQSTNGQYNSTIAPYARLGDQSTKTFSLSMRFSPISDLVVKGMVYFNRDEDGPAPIYKVFSSSYNCNAGAGGANNYYCGTIGTLNTTNLPVQTALDSLFQSQVFASKTLNPLFADTLTHPGFKRDTYHGHLDIEYHIPNTPLTLTALTSANGAQSEDLVDLDDQVTTNIPNATHAFLPNTTESYYQWYARVQNQTTDFSQELRLTSDQKARLRYTLGVNYSRAKSQGYVDGLFPFGATSFGDGGPNITVTEGVFGSGSFDILSNLTVSLEGRYQSDDVKVYSRPANHGPSLFVVGTTTKNFLPRAIIQYKPVPEVMMYASYSKGVNPPVFNNALVGEPADLLAQWKSKYGIGIAVNPEYLENYEVGVKGRFFQDKLQMSADVYYDNWTNQILSQFLAVPGGLADYKNGSPDAETVSTNGGLTHLYGVEVDGQFVVTPELVVSFAGAYNKTDIATYPGYYCPGDSCTPNGQTTNIVGHSLANAPLYSANLAATYTRRISAETSAYLRGDYIYKGSFYGDLSNKYQVGSSNKVNLRAGVTTGQSTFEAFVTNVFNDRQFTSIQGTTDIDAQINSLGAYPLAIMLGMPVLRQFGVRARHTF